MRGRPPSRPHENRSSGMNKPYPFLKVKEGLFLPSEYFFRQFLCISTYPIPISLRKNGSKKAAFRLSNFGALEFEIGGNPLVGHLPELNSFAVGIEEYGQISVTQMQLPANLPFLNLSLHCPSLTTRREIPLKF